MDGSRFTTVRAPAAHGAPSHPHSGLPLCARSCAAVHRSLLVQSGASSHIQGQSPRCGSARPVRPTPSARALRVRLQRARLQSSPRPQFWWRDVFLFLLARGLVALDDNLLDVERSMPPIQRVISPARLTTRKTHEYHDERSFYCCGAQDSGQKTCRRTSPLSVRGRVRRRQRQCMWAPLSSHRSATGNHVTGPYLTTL